MPDPLKAEQTAELLADVTSQAKAVLGELRSELREVRRERKALTEALEAAKSAAAQVVGERIDAEVQKGLDEYRSTISAAMDSATAKVKTEVEGLFNLYMTGNKQGKGPDLRQQLQGKRR